MIETGGGDDIFMVSRRGMTIRFNEDDVRPMGRGAAGVRGMKLKADDAVVSVDVARDDTAILMVTEAGYGKRTQLNQYNRQARGGQGVIGIKLTGRKGEVVAAFMVGIDDEIVAVSSGGVTIRMEVREISSQGRCGHRRAGDEPRRRPDGRLGGRDPRQRRRLTLDARVTRPASAPDGAHRTRRAREGRDARPEQRTTRGHDAVRPRRWRWCVVVVAVVATLAIAQLGRTVVDAGRARTAADAAALAGVEGGRAASPQAGRRARRELVSWSSSGPPDAMTVDVTVRVGRARATAAASNRGP